jgi:hypothetical protein
MTIPLRRLSVGPIVACSVGLAAASLHATTRTPRPDPLDADAAVPALTYTSSLKPGAQQTSDAPLSWREANDTVARIGGWRVYARQAAQPAPDATPAPALPASASPATLHVHDGPKSP